MDPLLTTDEVANYYKVPKTTIYKWNSDGSGPRAIRVGKHLRFRLSEVERWLEAQATTGQPAA